MQCDDMEKGTEEPKELEGAIRAAIIRLKCGYSLQEYIRKAMKRITDGLWKTGEWSEQRMIWLRLAFSINK